MKKVISIIFILAVCLNSIGTVDLQKDDNTNKIIPVQVEQSINLGVSWTKHMIEEDISHASGIFTVDIDQDGDYDVVSCGANDNEVAFWRNDGGSLIQWTKYSIDDNYNYPMDVIACDIENDGDIDVLGAAWAESEISLWKNNGQNPIKWNKQIIKGNYPGAHEVYAYDFDEDGDLDVFGASAGSNRIDWWRNDGGIPIQWTEQSIGKQFGGARSVYVADIDGDGDNDVLGAALTDNKISWYRNDGGDPIVWNEYVITDDFLAAHHVYAEDVDNDGDVDVLGTAYSAGEISWWSNEGGDPIIWEKQKIASNFNGAMKVGVADINNDGYKDIIGTSSLTNSICWFSNNGGNPITWTKYVIDNTCQKAWPFCTVDMDDDGDIDIFAGSEANDGIMWYENSLYPVESDLECEGSIVLTDVKPESTVAGSFNVMNVGKSGSSLKWSIEEFPDWGSWTFEPDNGEDLTPEDGKIRVDVSIEAPSEKDSEFTGQIKIVNDDNQNDFYIIEVTLKTPKTHSLIFYKLMDCWLKISAKNFDNFIKSIIC